MPIIFPIGGLVISYISNPGKLKTVFIKKIKHLISFA